MKVASDKCSVKKSINMLASCGSCLHENICVGVFFFILSIAKFFRALILSAASEQIIKIIHKENFTLKNCDFFSSNIRNK